MRTEDDILTEARRLLDRAADAGILLRAIGGLAVRIHADNDAHRLFGRECRDIDFVTRKEERRRVARLLTEAGYAANEPFNVINPGRLLYYDPGRPRHIDVFCGEFRMCHPLPVTKRLELEPETTPLAELLLTKLQIVQLNEKDVRDIASLLYSYPIRTTDSFAINGEYVAELCARNWGLWRTVTDSLARANDVAGAICTDAYAVTTVRDRTAQLRAMIDRQPKTLAWRTRQRLGDRVRWYDEPEEIEHRTPPSATDPAADHTLSGRSKYEH